MLSWSWWRMLLPNHGAAEDMQIVLNLRLASPVSSRRLGPLRRVPPVQENLNPPSLFFASKLLLQRVEEVGSMSGYDEQKSRHSLAPQEECAL